MHLCVVLKGSHYQEDQRSCKGAFSLMSQAQQLKSTQQLSAACIFQVWWLLCGHLSVSWCKSQKIQGQLEEGTTLSRGGKICFIFLSNFENQKLGKKTSQGQPIYIMFSLTEAILIKINMSMHNINKMIREDVIRHAVKIWLWLDLGLCTDEGQRSARGSEPHILISWLYSQWSNENIAHFRLELIEPRKMVHPGGWSL